MGLRQAIPRFISYLFFVLPSKNRTIDHLISALASSGATLSKRATALSDTPQNRDQLRHIIGIERWGQQRLKGALGESATRDEYDAYAPAADASWETLKTSFHQTRAETVALGRTLGERGLLDHKIDHNDFGPLAVRSWLRYLDSHARIEARRLK